MLSINTNIPSLIAQCSLNNSTKLLNQAIERMTTGFKINHASDNAANFSISTNMTTKIGAYEVAEDNVASGLDLLSTAGGSLDLISDKLTRLRALAEQSANGTYGDQSLKAINSEANAIVDEIERIYSTAEYNGIKLFGTNGSFIQGFEQCDTSSMTKLSSVDPEQLLAGGKYSISTEEELFQFSDMLNNSNIGADTEFVLANNINLSSGYVNLGYKEEFSSVFNGNGYVITGNKGFYFNNNNGEIKNLGVICSDENYALVDLGGGVNGTFSNCFQIGGDSISIDGISHIDLSDISTLKPSSQPHLFDFQIGIYDDFNSQIKIDTSLTLPFINLLRCIGSEDLDFLSFIDNLSSQVSMKQTDLGAVENRLESALEEISTQYDNLVSSRSTLRDADIAEVSSDYIRQQILQQASATLMATANQSPSLALQLI